MKDIILKVLNDYFQGTTGDVKDYDIENCARDIVEAIEAAQPDALRVGGTSQEISVVCSKCGNPTPFTIEFPARKI